MSAERLEGLKVAILVENGFEQVELVEPRKALDAAGAETCIVSPQQGQVRAWALTDWGDEFPVDLPLDSARRTNSRAPAPGGVLIPIHCEFSRRPSTSCRLLRDGKPVAAICHGPWTIIEAGAVRGRRIASWPSLRTDLRNAGAEWADQEVVVDRNLVSSRKPDDIPAFNRAMIELFGRVLRACDSPSLSPVSAEARR